MDAPVSTQPLGGPDPGSPSSSPPTTGIITSATSTCAWTRPRSPAPACGSRPPSGCVLERTGNDRYEGQIFFAVVGERNHALGAATRAFRQRPSRASVNQSIHVRLKNRLRATSLLRRSWWLAEEWRLIQPLRDAAVEHERNQHPDGGGCCSMPVPPVRVIPRPRNGYSPTSR